MRPNVLIVVSQGKIIGYERAGKFVPLGENCCENPLECKRCFGPVDTWWAWWRR